MSGGIDLSIVLLTWNGRELALACLASIERVLRGPAATLAVETIVVDNGSRDGTVEAVRARFPWSEVLALPRNLGFAAGNNVGLARARGRHVALLNNDTEVLPGCFEACVRLLDAQPDVGVVGPQLLHPDGRLQNSIHNAPTLLGELVPRGLLEVLAPRRFPSKRFHHAGPLDVEAVLGACMVVRRAALDAVGPLPEDYFFFLEETDWLCAMRAGGWRVVHLPEARLVHLHGATTKKRIPLPTRIEYHRSLYHFFRKRRGPTQGAAVVAVRLAKLVLALVVLAPLALVLPRERARWRERAAILAWHARGCPRSWGLAGSRAAEGAA
jgi:GT2 family glycosyltransferase